MVRIPLAGILGRGEMGIWPYILAYAVPPPTKHSPASPTYAIIKLRHGTCSNLSHTTLSHTTKGFF